MARTITSTTISNSEILARIEARINGTPASRGGLNALQVVRLQNGDVLRLVVATPATAESEGHPATEAQYASVQIRGVNLSDRPGNDGWDELAFELSRPTLPGRIRIRLSLGQLTAVPLESRGFRPQDAVDQRLGDRNLVWNASTFQTRKSYEILEALVSGIIVSRVYLGKVDGVTRRAYRFDRL